MRTSCLLVSATLLSSACSSVLVTHVAGNDYNTPGLRYWLPAPYLLVRTPLEISRTESLYSMSPVDKTVLRLVVPCDDSQGPCAPHDKPTAPTRLPLPPLSPPGAQAGRSGAGSDAAGGHATEAPREHGGAPAASIVWLPDYCQQYSILEKDHAGSQKVQIQLADGWKLAALNTEINNTEVLQKMFDTLSSVAGSTVDPTRKLTGSVASSLSGSGAQSAQTRLFRRTRVVTFKPGLYQLLEYPLNTSNEVDCSKIPSFRPPKDAVDQSEIWSEVAASPASAMGVSEAVVSIPVAPVEPGRPANVPKPPLH